LVPRPDARLVVGFDLADDAGVVRLPDGTGLIQTIDFFTPVVDDPFTYGAIAASNALSDVYAMGGRPLSAMNVVAFPSKDLPEWVLTEILKGGSSVLVDAGAMLVGGHSVRDQELKYGLAVSGLVDLDRLWTNAGAQAGDQLVLTKPIGTGVLTTARKRDMIDDMVLQPAVDAMLQLNRAAAEAGMAGTVHAATDVTGNGLAGHAWEMARASQKVVELWWDRVPQHPAVYALARAGAVPGGTRSNQAYVGAALTLLDGLGDDVVDLALDPQTSGGLLLSVPATELAPLRARLEGAGVLAAHVGQVVDGQPGVVIRRDGA
jgi:selenide,water dikinase